MKIAMEELDVEDFLKLYCENINTRFDGNVVCVSGFYRQKSITQSGNYFYDEIFSKESDYRISLMVSPEHRKTLIDGKNYSLKGYVNRQKKIEKESRIKLNFLLLEINGVNNDKQLFNEEQYDLLRSRSQRGFIDVKQLLLKSLEKNLKKKIDIAVITGNESIVDKDFYSQFEAYDKFNVCLIRTSLGSGRNLAKFIREKDFNVYSLVCFMRGGGSGLDVFDNEELCQSVLNLKKPFITALGHDTDMTYLSKIADLNISTPSALGVFFQSVNDIYEKQVQRIFLLREELLNKIDVIEEKEVIVSKQKTKIDTLSLVIVVLMSALVIVGLLFLRESGKLIINV